MKLKTDVALRSGIAGDYAKTQILCDERYGTGYITKNAFEQWLKPGALFKVAMVNDEYAGFAVLLLATTPQIMEAMGMPEDDVLRIVGEKPALIYKSAALKEKFEHQGVMKALMTELFHDAGAQGYGTVFGSAWVVNGELPIGGIFSTFAFERLYERKMLWYHDENYHCVVCNGRCRCDAIIYYKKLGDE